MEPEFLPVYDDPHTAQTVLPFIGSLIPSIEAVDHRYADFTKVGTNALIADNAIHGVSVLGKPVDNWKMVDLAGHAIK